MQLLGGPSKRVPFLYIFADTLVVDEPFLPSPSTTIVARALSIEGATPLVAPDPRTVGISGVCSIQLLTQQVEGGPLQSSTSATWWRTTSGRPRRSTNGALAASWPPRPRPSPRCSPGSTSTPTMRGDAILYEKCLSKSYRGCRSVGRGERRVFAGGG
jgi:hypothetical protein